MIATGIPLFLSESLRCYYSPPFWWKMQLLPIAILFTFTVRRRFVLSAGADSGAAWGKLVGLASLALWFGVGFSGRWIAFY